MPQEKTKTPRAPKRAPKPPALPQPAPELVQTNVVSSVYKMLINASDPEEFRVAIVEDGKLEEFALEVASREQLKAISTKGSFPISNQACRRLLSIMGRSARVFCRFRKSTRSIFNRKLRVGAGPKFKKS